MSENEIVYRFLLYVFEARKDEIKSFYPKILAVVAHVFSQAEKAQLTQDIFNRLGEMVHLISRSDPSILSNVLQSLPESHQIALLPLVS